MAKEQKIEFKGTVLEKTHDLYKIERAGTDTPHLLCLYHKKNRLMKRNHQKVFKNIRFFDKNIRKPIDIIRFS